MCCWNSFPTTSSTLRADLCRIRDKGLCLCLSSGWPGCWRSDRPRLYQTRPPRWSTRCTGPGGRLHRRPSLLALGQQPRLTPLLFSDSSFSSCSSASFPPWFCTATPRLASPCSSWRTWLDTASGTSHAWVTQQRLVFFWSEISREAGELLRRCRGRNLLRLFSTRKTKWCTWVWLCQIFWYCIYFQKHCPYFELIVFIQGLEAVFCFV